MVKRKKLPLPARQPRQSADALVRDKQRALVSRHPRLHEPVAPAKPRLLPAPFDPSAIVLGRDLQERPLVLPERPRLEHMHVIGATGSGKTNFLEHCIRQDIVHGRGVCVVDPHGNHPGSLYRSLLHWLERSGYTSSRTIHLIDPNEPTHTIGFNPLHADSDTAYSVIAEAMFEAFERMWGDEDGNSKPTIQRVLTATFTALAEQSLTLAETRLLFDPDDSHGIRASVLNQLNDRYAHEEMDWLHRISMERNGARDFRAEVVGPLNRIAKLVRSEALRTIVGQSERVIDLREAMDDGHIILANLSGGGRVYEQGADLLGRLLTRFLFFHVRRRKHPERAYFIYLDEAHRYLSGDLPNLLAEVRKYGLGVVLAHQWLAQLGPPDDPVREAVCKGPNLKVVFRVKDPREAAELAEAVMPLDLEQPVSVLTKPAVVGHVRTLFGNFSVGKQQTRTETTGESIARSISETVGEGIAESEGESHSVTTTESESSMEVEGSSNSEGNSRGEAASYDCVPFDLAMATGDATPNVRVLSSGAFSVTSEGRSSARGTSTSVAESGGHFRSTTKSHSHARTEGETAGRSKSTAIGTGTSQTMGASEGLEPIYANLPTAVHSKENALYFAAQELLSLPTGEARLSYVGDRGRYTGCLRVPRMRGSSLSDESFGALRRNILSGSTCALPLEQAVNRIAERERRLKAEANNQYAKLVEPESFRVRLLKQPDRPVTVIDTAKVK